jgi:hypothetical protein
MPRFLPKSANAKIIFSKDRFGKDRFGKDRFGKDRFGEDRFGKDRLFTAIGVFDRPPQTRSVAARSRLPSGRASHCIVVVFNWSGDTPSGRQYWRFVPLVFSPIRSFVVKASTAPAI